MTETDRRTKKEKIQEDFLWELGPKAMQQNTRPDCRTEPVKLKIDKILKLYNRHFYREDTNKIHEEIFGQKNQIKNTSWPLQNFDWSRKNCDFPRFRIKLLSKFNKSFTKKATSKIVEPKIRCPENSETNTTEYMR